MICRRCTTDKPITDFYRDSSRANGYDPRCKHCHNSSKNKLRQQVYMKTYGKEYYRKNKSKYVARAKQYTAELKASGKLYLYQKAQRLRQKFGLTVEQYDSMLKQQDSRCAICETTEPRGAGDFHVDHDHKTNQIRGLLCSNCNLALGGFKDSVDTLKRAIKYLCISRP